ncbi:MAG: DNA-binding response regulator, partial [Bacteroidota bacterium]|nr:DNA-binding response regulator [Bacteroidota bacterium]
MKALLKILAVDDHQFFLKGISECFGALAITEQVDTCSTYKSLQLKLQQGLPDIVFLDLNMPEHDGFSICREIKRDHENVFVAMLTQYDSEKFVNKARQCGAGAYFIKNTEPEVFSRFLSNFKDGKIKDFFVHIPSTEKSPEFEG